MLFLSGFESTHIFGSGTDVLELTRHYERVEQDLWLARLTGMRQMRYSAPWHSIEKVPGRYDWSWMDRAMRCMRDLGIEPILDPLHHTSFPDWLEGGFANPNFADLYLSFVTALAERYPWVRHYTVINEPFVTTWFCGHEGCWYPFHRGPENFVPMLMNVVEAIISVSRMLVAANPGVRLIHVDAAERHRAGDESSVEHAERGNNLRFLVQDLVLGRVDDDHALYDYLIKNGAEPERLAGFRDQPGRIDVIGLDYYAHCELEWRSEGRIFPNRMAEGLVPTAVDYAERYRLPVMLSETNIRGFVSDRITWLKFMVEQCERIEREVGNMGIPFEGFCWYPFIDSTDWCSLVKQARGHIDPQGIYWLDRATMKRHSSELSDLYRALALGQITSKDIPAYCFQAPLDHDLQGFMSLMEHWNWTTSGRKNRRIRARRPMATAGAMRRARPHDRVGRIEIGAR
jgi:beta-glucosidase/6-phospho-beta-glucosidase/beta-galactosidase